MLMSNCGCGNCPPGTYSHRKESIVEPLPSNDWFVYVIQSQVTRVSAKTGRTLPGFFYVGSSTDPRRRLLQHNGLKSGGGKYTSKSRPWKLMAVHGPYANRSEGFRAEKALKKLRGQRRLNWTTKDSHWCRGPGVNHEWVTETPEPQ